MELEGNLGSVGLAWERVMLLSPLPVPALGGRGESCCLGILPLNWGEAAPWVG